MGSVLGGEAEVVKEDRGEDLPPVLHKAWGAAGRGYGIGRPPQPGRATTTGWVQIGELQRGVAGGGDWLARLGEDGLGECREGWSLGELGVQRRVRGPTVAGHEVRGQW